MNILIKNGRVLDPATDKDGIYDILVTDNIITKVESNIDEDAIKSEQECKVIDASNQFVMPGLIDLHVHFREPGFEYKETIKTGSLSAARGGFTSVCPMPNTKPVIDSVEMLEKELDIIKRDAVVNVYPVAAITKGMKGEELTDIRELVKHGAIAISEDGKSVMNSSLLREAMKIAKETGIPVLSHCEDINLVEGGVMNKGERSEELGLKGISNAVEDIIVARDIMLAKETGCRLHLCHCSTYDSVRLIEEAKKEGLPVTGEVCPHHFSLTEEDIVADDANYKMNPPIRTKKDVDELIAGIHNNIMDIISTDHAPHSEEEKTGSMTKAPFGIVGLETSVSLVVTELLDKGVITPLKMAEIMSYNPAKVIGIDRGTLQVGKVADITIIDPNKEYVIDKNEFVSKGKNTPFDGKKVKGKVMTTIVNGKIVYSEC
ncbi:dihydroorotase [Falcatimonas sp. MSJ-15]|uniref:dihydroorotase n=1 Tax=Falcatimonas sp. MSJ-15 TaxID=2841515 RepID=UPI001C0FAE58|nr:dihydroorotase [Falcatimonas sp. MSJ-15]MBU5470716.1 dihydroorotase [Falcatimonas sp. MSJ-15]